jgi:hypothetical protein
MADVNQLITDFYRVAANREFARDYNFRVLNINTGGVSNITFDNDDLVYVKTATLPERSITNVTVPYMGLNFNVPGNATYPGSDAYTLTFYADAKSQIRQKFEQWSQDVFNDATSTGNYFSPKQTAVIDLVQLDNQMNKIAQYQLVGVSVRSVGPLAYNIAEGTGNTVEFTATLSFHYWRKIS